MEQELIFVDKLPEKSAGLKGRWSNILLPLTKHPNRWALVRTMESPDQALAAQSNLSSRQVLIPQPKHIWEFAARGCEVYAIYRGKRRASDAGLRRANRR